MPRPFKPYDVTYIDKEGNQRTVGLHAKDAFQARCLCIELVGKEHITKVEAPRLVPDFDW